MVALDGVTSNWAVNVLVCDANEVFTHPPPFLAVTQGAFTTRVTVVQCESVPSVPHTLIESLPVGVELLVVTDSVEEPEPPLMEVGFNVALTPVGNPLVLNMTVAE